MGTIWAILGAVLWLGAASTLAYQVYVFLSLGVWPPLNALLLLRLADGSSVHAWATEPGSWIGVHVILSWLPLSLTLVALALVCQVCQALASEGGKPH